MHRDDVLRRVTLTNSSVDEKIEKKSFGQAYQASSDNKQRIAVRPPEHQQRASRCGQGCRRSQQMIFGHLLRQSGRKKCQNAYHDCTYGQRYEVCQLYRGDAADAREGCREKDEAHPAPVDT